MSPPVHNPYRGPFLAATAVLHLVMLVTWASVTPEPGIAQAALLWAGALLAFWFAVRLSMIMVAADAMPGREQAPEMTGGTR